MKINGTYIHAKGTPPDELAQMQRTVIHCNLALAWAKEYLKKELVENGSNAQIHHRSATRRNHEMGGSLRRNDAGGSGI